MKVIIGFLHLFDTVILLRCLIGLMLGWNIHHHWFRGRLLLGFLHHFVYFVEENAEANEPHEYYKINQSVRKTKPLRKFWQR